MGAKGYEIKTLDEHINDGQSVFAASIPGVGLVEYIRK
jgi:hypothetical protein